MENRPLASWGVHQRGLTLQAIEENRGHSWRGHIYGCYIIQIMRHGLWDTFLPINTEEWNNGCWNLSFAITGICYILNYVKTENRTEFSASLLQSSRSHDPSEIILICWFAAQEVFWLLTMLKTVTETLINTILQQGNINLVQRDRKDIIMLKKITIQINCVHFDFLLSKNTEKNRSMDFTKNRITI